jgi:hypothetical protein
MPVKYLQFNISIKVELLRKLQRPQKTQVNTPFQVQVKKNRQTTLIESLI